MEFKNHQIEKTPGQTVGKVTSATFSKKPGQILATQFIERQSANLLVVIQYDTQKLDNLKVIDSIDISYR